METRFESLEDFEVRSLVNGMVNTHSLISIWSDSVQPLAAVVDGRKESNQVVIRFSSKLTEENFGAEIKFSTQFRNSDYFGEVLIHSVDQERGTALLEMKNVFKSEKRRKERFLVYPHHKIFVYFKVVESTATPSNVTFINRNEKDANKYFSHLVVDKIRSLNERENLIGLRVIDISTTGISFMVNRIERKFFSETNGDLSLIVDINGKEVVIENASIVYSIDYIDSRFFNIQMYKIGITFQENNVLSYNLSELFLTDSKEENNEREDFEQFLSNFFKKK